MKPTLFLIALISTSPYLYAASGTKAGVAKVEITPSGPIWMAGYAARTKPSEGATPIWAKALALQDAKGTTAVIVTTDLIGLPKSITDVVSAKVIEQYKLERSQIVFNSSHTHTGPVVRNNLSVMGAQEPAQKRVVEEYANTLRDKLVTVIAAALGDIQPAALAFDYGETGFATNRRVVTDKGVLLGVNPNGPVDHKVPVLRVVAPNGQVRAVLFGYACHNTTLTAEFYEITGDYAGFAQAAVERAYPGATALFMQLCAGDQNPNPRSKLEFAQQHGASLGGEVARVVKTPMKPVSGRIKSVYQMAELPFAPHSSEQFTNELKDQNVFKSRRAAMMLALYQEGRAPRTLQYPVQVIRFDQGFTLVALGGEVVIDYSLWVQRTFPGERLMVAGYSNDVACYIPSARVLREGGYEAVDSMIYYGHPGPFTEEVEPRIQDAITKAMSRVKK
ncbi:neutral/alkaline non-lysosomal ceramidase N-terminal domain-containing protein [Paludibaculum fermentans]|uniref:Neutral/alkaline non-lysosomal ceramidase N-terminal domain-containing protein n=1 Tax=Paludibaculum fermentans TaxID=1473598 RepID=A0A7S7SGJ5_PALFE|nr:neutral/alkaline non-lysosomal ceramidase N-terminal domain-containing protein [Paludibaculum fermentans]QOY84907.1 neutral/alkaline non-lysosomal ceramidase N-terminal domain-containing protein [Paludibaculum fermentans]